VTPPRVLIVDDDPALLEALSEALQLRMGEVDVTTSESALAALETLAASEVDAVVADIRMPKMDGLQLLARIRELRPNTPTLLITGHGEHELAVQALRGGAYDYVQKPIDRDYFVGSLRRAIQTHQLKRELERQRSALEHHAQELEKCVTERTIELRELYHREQTMRAELDDAHHKLAEAQRQREDLVSMIAHDLAGPLTAVKGYADALERPNTPPPVRQRAQKVIKTVADQMTRLVSDLADSGRLSTGQFQVRTVACDLASIARGQVETAAARAEQHTIQLEAPPELPVTGDPDRLAQVLANLLSNTLTHAPGGEVRVRVWTERRNARVSVSDEGPGIPTEALEAIFEPRRQLTGSRSAGKPTGAGLGLHIARGIVEAHGGRLWAESPPGGGATFHVSLPLRSRPSRKSQAR
jgi:two-component system, sensor histidine kinase and response regulator